MEVVMEIKRDRYLNQLNGVLNIGIIDFLLDPIVL